MVGGHVGIMTIKVVGCECDVRINRRLTDWIATFGIMGYFPVLATCFLSVFLFFLSFM